MKREAYAFRLFKDAMSKSRFDLSAPHLAGHAGTCGAVLKPEVGRKLSEYLKDFDVTALEWKPTFSGPALSSVCPKCAPYAGALAETLRRKWIDEVPLLPVA